MDTPIITIEQGDPIIKYNGNEVDFTVDIERKQSIEIHLAAYTTELNNLLIKYKDIYARYPNQLPQEVVTAFELNVKP